MTTEMWSEDQNPDYREAILARINADLKAEVVRLTEAQDAAASAISRLTQERDEARTQKDSAYAERNQTVAALIRAAAALGCPAGVTEHDGADGEDDWRTVVFADLPAGQVSWHFHDGEKHLLDGLPRYAGKWDGHTTTQKYERVNAWRPSITTWSMLDAVRADCGDRIAALTKREAIIMEEHEKCSANLTHARFEILALTKHAEAAELAAETRFGRNATLSAKVATLTADLAAAIRRAEEAEALKRECEHQQRVIDTLKDRAFLTDKRADALEARIEKASAAPAGIGWNIIEHHAEGEVLLSVHQRRDVMNELRAAQNIRADLAAATKRAEEAEGRRVDVLALLHARNAERQTLRAALEQVHERIQGDDRSLDIVNRALEATK